MINQITTIKELLAVINYIVWSYDVNNSTISNKGITISAQSLSNVVCRRNL